MKMVGFDVGAGLIDTILAETDNLIKPALFRQSGKKKSK
jgi:hypothetical protein